MRERGKEREGGGGGGGGGGRGGGGTRGRRDGDGEREREGGEGVVGSDVLLTWAVVELRYLSLWCSGGHQGGRPSDAITYLYMHTYMYLS